jgi:hypothetical protein
LSVHNLNLELFVAKGRYYSGQFGFSLTFLYQKNPAAGAFSFSPFSLLLPPYDL